MVSGCIVNFLHCPVSDRISFQIRATKSAKPPAGDEWIIMTALST